MDAVDLCHAGAAKQARLVRTGQVSARELVQATLDRIETVDPSLNSFRVVLADQALAAAAEADRDRVGGRTLPLLGVPVAVKDDVDVACQVTAWGTDANRTPAAPDSPLVAQLRAAGAVIVGKTTCSELVVWPFTETLAWGATRNPWDTDFSPGGSSGGSGVAVAAGLCGLAVGSDGLGSVRVPAGFCGVFGLKPQSGRVWHDPLDWHGMAVNGPLSRTVADAALFLDVAAGNKPAGGFRAVLADRRPLRVALAWRSAAFYPLAARLGQGQRLAVDRIADTLEGLGHTVNPCEVRFPLATSVLVGRRIPHFAPWNAIGQPTVSVPAGFDSRGLPVSVQLAGPPASEAMLLALSAQLEDALGWTNHRPLE